VPVWVAATSGRTARLAASRGLPLLLGMHDDDRAKAAMVADHAAARVAPVAGHASVHLAHVADSTDDARATLRRTMPGWLAGTAEHRRVDGGPRPPRDLDAYLRHLLDIHPVGTADHCVQRIRESVAATGVTRVLLAVEGAGDPELVRENVRRLGRDVVPHLTGAMPSPG
jgi:hypothetical protein